MLPLSQREREMYEIVIISSLTHHDYCLTLQDIPLYHLTCSFPPIPSSIRTAQLMIESRFLIVDQSFSRLINGYRFLEGLQSQFARIQEVDGNLPNGVYKYKARPREREGEREKERGDMDIHARRACREPRLMRVRATTRINACFQKP